MENHVGMRPISYIHWITLLISTQVMLALWGILSRYLQIKPNAPAPALRLVFVISMLAESTLLLCHTLPTTFVRRCSARVRSGSGTALVKSRSLVEEQQTSGRIVLPESGPLPFVTAPAAARQGEALHSTHLRAKQSPNGAADIPSPVLVYSSADEHCTAHPTEQGTLHPMCDPAVDVSVAIPVQQNTDDSISAVPAALDCSSHCGYSTHAVAQVDPAGDTTLLCTTPAVMHAVAQKGSLQTSVQQRASPRHTHDAIPTNHCPGQGNEGGTSGRLQRYNTSVRPELAMQRGLSRRFSRVRRSNPRLARFAALATLTVSFSATCGLQLCAPGFVDPSVVQLINQFTAVGTALGQALLLRHRLHWMIWPCVAAMTGGAAMVIVPSLGKTEAGGLGTARGWLGFGMSAIALVSTVVYFITLQATRHMGYTATQLQHYFLCFSILVFMTLSLPIDGTAWRAQFGGWTAGDWLILVFESSIAYVGSAAAMQHCVWRLGAPVVSMSLGLRLVFTASLTKPILGASVITSGVQIGGVVLTAGAVTTYVGVQWWNTRTRHRADSGQKSCDVVHSN